MAEDDRHSDLFEQGLAMRRAVLGSEYVDRSIRNADAFTQPFQKLVTEWCWGEIWNRPARSQDAQPDQSGDVDRAQSPQRDPASRPRSAQQRCYALGNPGGVAADNGLLRRSGGA